MKRNDAEGVADRNDEIGHNLQAVRAAVDAQLRDAEAMASLYRTAERYARAHRDSGMARDLVWDVVGDVLLGGLTCDPERPVTPQLQREVRRRANRLRRANRPRREVPQPMLVALDRAPARALVLDAWQESVAGDDQALDLAELVPRIREQARGDEPAQQLLALYERGLVLRRQVLRTGMKEWVYRAARERLARYAEQAIAVASTAAPAVQPMDADDAQSTVLPATRAIASEDRTERAGARTLDGTRGLRTA